MCIRDSFLYNGVAQLIRKLCFVIFDLREVGIIKCVCSSSAPNVVRPKAQLKEHTVDKDFKLKHSQ